MQIELKDAFNLNYSDGSRGKGMLGGSRVCGGRALRPD